MKNTSKKKQITPAERLQRASAKVNRTIRAIQGVANLKGLGPAQHQQILRALTDAVSGVKVRFETGKNTAGFQLTD